MRNHYCGSARHHALHKGKGFHPRALLAIQPIPGQETNSITPLDTMTPYIVSHRYIHKLRKARSKAVQGETPAKIPDILTWVYMTKNDKKVNAFTDYRGS